MSYYKSILNVLSPAISYLVDDYSPTAAYSLRKISSTSTNCIRVRRSSDNAEQDIGFVGVDLDTASLTAFVGANSGYVTKWYNQGTGGATWDSANTTASAQPRIVNAGTIEVKNSKSALRFLGSQRLITANNADTLSAKPFSWGVVATNEVANGYGVAMSNIDTNDTNSGAALILDRRVFKDMAVVDSVNENAVYIDYLSQIDNSNQRLQILNCDNSWNVKAFYNGVEQGTTTLTANPAPISEKLYLGVQTTVYYLNGYIQEALVFTTDQSANRTAIETDINTYYGIY